MSLLSDDEKVQHLQQRWSEGALDLKAVELLLGEVIESGAWKSLDLRSVQISPKRPLLLLYFPGWLC